MLNGCGIASWWAAEQRQRPISCMAPPPGMTPLVLEPGMAWPEVGKRMLEVHALDAEAHAIAIERHSCLVEWIEAGGR